MKIVSEQSKNPKTIPTFTLFRLALKVLLPTQNWAKNIATTVDTRAYPSVHNP